MFQFNSRYFLLSLLLIGVEIFIGVRMHDALIRPYGADLLCVILLYCLIRSFWRIPVLPLALGVLLFSYAEEASQYFHMADRLGFTKPSLMRTLIGTCFTWGDIGCYTFGIGVVLLLETRLRCRQSTPAAINSNT